MWDAKTGAEVWSKSDHAADVLAVAYSADGSSLSTAGADGFIRLRDPATGAVKQTLDGHEGGATSVVFLPGGAQLVGGAADGSASLWDVNIGKRTRMFRPAAPAAKSADGVRRITSVTVSPDGGMLATCSASADSAYGDRIVRVWDVRTGDLKPEIATSQTAGRFVVFSPEGTTLATSGPARRSPSTTFGRGS
jgi:WD40 repeat protein